MALHYQKRHKSGINLMNFANTLAKALLNAKSKYLEIAEQPLLSVLNHSCSLQVQITQTSEKVEK